MCIAIYKPAGQVITDAQLQASYDNNGDGCGFCYINTDHLGVRRLVIKKTMDFATFKRQYNRAVRIAPDSPFLVHFRIRTHGETTTFNCHPFQIDENHAFIHNGIIRGMRADTRKNDTQIFNEDVLQRLPEGWMHSEAIKFLIEEYITYNKIVVMNIDGDVTIYNEGKGVWDNGVWFSNTSYKPRAIVTTYDYRTTNTGTRGGSYGGGSTVYRLPGSTFQYTLAHRVKCKSCNSVSNTIKEMFHFYDASSGNCESYCLHCVGDVSEGFERIGSTVYLDFKNSKTQDVYQDAQHYFDSWTNPWAYGPQDDDEYDEGLATVGSMI